MDCRYVSFYIQDKKILLFLKEFLNMSLTIFNLAILKTMKFLQNDYYL